jgi:hypothetical protein
MMAFLQARDTDTRDSRLAPPLGKLGVKRDPRVKGMFLEGPEEQRGRIQCRPEREKRRIR